MTFLNTDAPAWSFLRGFEPASLCDWPGKVSAVLFFAGCNLRCPTCHNASIAWNPHRSRPVDHKSILQQILKNRKWLDGLVLTGGEVTILPGLDDFLKTLSLTGLPIKLDTNGLKPGSVKMALKHGFIEKIAVDIKGPWEKYPHLCGGLISSSRIMSCASKIFKMAVSSPERFMFRCTMVPGLDSSDLRVVRSYLPRGFELRVQKYLPPGAGFSAV